MKNIVIVCILGLILLAVSFNRSIPEYVPSEIQSGKYQILKIESVGNFETKLVLKSESGNVISTKVKFSDLDLKNLNGYIYINQ